MIKMSEIFSSGYYKTVEEKIRDLINEQDNWLSEQVVKSTRAAGDSIEDIISGNFEVLLGKKYCKSYSSDFARRAMADLAFEDYKDFYHVIDVKTHRLETKFNMPNITSVERLSRFYESDKNYFVLLLVSYDVSDLKVFVRDVKFVPIEYLDWECLTIGALGWGQIQIANSNKVMLKDKPDRAKWMIELCDTLLSFYPKEIAKIDIRIEHFQKIRAFWSAKI